MMSYDVIKCIPFGDSVLQATAALVVIVLVK